MTDSYTQNRRGYQSLFWPVILIGIGTIWLLSNAGIFTATNLAVLGRIWPLLLIIIGLDMLFGRQSRTMGALIGVGSVILIIALMLVGPSMGLVGNYEIQTVTYSADVGDADSARIAIRAGVETVNINALPESGQLINADLTYYGEIIWDLESDATGLTTVTLQEEGGSIDFSGGFFATLFGAPQDNAALWDIQLNRDLPLELDINGGVGTLNLDLREMNVTGVTASLGVGGTEIWLPATDASYAVSIDGGVGGVTIHLPEGANVQLTADVGVGGIDVPGYLSRVSGDDGFIGGSGVWETEGFANADVQITIEYDGGVGGLTVR